MMDISTEHSLQWQQGTTVHAAPLDHQTRGGLIQKAGDF
jgi:hypothetical protein